MDTLVTVCAIIGAIAIKVLFFFLYARLSADKAPKKAVPYEVVQKGDEPGGKQIKRILGIASSALEGKPFIAPGHVRVPFVWVEDAARAHVDAVEQLLFPQPGAPRIHGRAYHLCHDPVRDPFLYREFGGAALLQASLDAKHEAVRAAEEAAGVRGPPPPTVNAYNMKINGGISYGIIRRLALVNYWLGQRLGFTLIDATLTPVALRYAANHWPCDVADARRLLGWEATPWRVVAARLGEEALETMPSARRRYVAWPAGGSGAGAGGGKAKVA
ncbi:hypothetical protein TSOC_003687 [Tetrabaena socialis]|uniref:Uncharacterized protein n=1 Tax=Tetrabaena socialis TaxID=47790 RepID=A0A2J8AB09_9CHLO|nr:hypothetical protein TSOC_003687 [Tetrabaena socialis]|eukprot:PNH09705.1 hypothetical protein TSOC_003687 [Tetrabaena socialis]